MMKTTGFVCLLCMSIILACDPSKKENNKEEAIQDSITDSDRQAVLDAANTLLADSLITDTTSQENSN